MEDFLQFIFRWQNDYSLGRPLVDLHQPRPFLSHRVTRVVEEHLKVLVSSLDKETGQDDEEKVAVEPVSSQSMISSFCLLGNGGGPISFTMSS